MNKKELQELKKQLKFDNDQLLIKGIQEAYGKCDDGNASIQYTRTIDPFDLEKEEGELYFDIFKRSLGGTPGKTLFEYAFNTLEDPSKQLQTRLYNLKNGDLLDEQAFETLAKDLLEKGDYRNNVYIIGGLFEYSVGGMNANREALEDGSTFRFMVVAITEARLTRIGLYYSRADNQVARKVNEEMEILSNPLDAFVYPSFSDRSSDVNHVIYHCKSAKSPNIGLIEDFFHIPFTTSAPEQSDGFATLIAEVFPQGLYARTALRFHENISDYVREYSEEQSNVTLRKDQVRDLLMASGAQGENMEAFDSAYSKILEDQELCAVNLMENGKISVKAPSINVSVKDDALDKIQTRQIDGKPCLVITLDEEVELSGLPVNFLEPKKKVIIHSAASPEESQEAATEDQPVSDPASFNVQ